MSAINPQIIPLQPIPFQTLNTVVGNQNINLNIYAKNIQIPIVPSGGIPTIPPVYEEINLIFIDVYLNDVLVVGGIRCTNNTKIIRNSYFGVVGDFAFQDTQGSDDPQYTGLNSRWLLVYYPTLE